MSVALALTDRRKLARDIGTTVGVRVAALPLSLITSILLARTLAPAGKGVYTTVLTFGELAVVVGSAGIASAAVYYLARERERTEALRKASLGLALIAGSAVSLALLVVPLVLPQPFAEIPPVAFLVLLPLGVLSLVRSMLESFLRAEQQVQRVNGIALTSSLYFVLAVVLVLVAGLLTPTVAVGLRVSIAAVGCLVAVYFLVRLSVKVPRPALLPPETKLLLAYGLPYGLYAVSQAFSQRSDYLLLQHYRGVDEVGLYSISVAQGELLWFLPVAVGFVEYPRAAARAKTDPDRAAAETATLMRWIVAATAVAAAALALLAEPLTWLMYGSAYLDSVGPLRILLVGLVASTWVQVLGGHLFGIGRLRAIVAASVAGMALNIALNLVFVPRLGMEGAALSSTMSYTATGLLVVWIFGQAHPELRRRTLFPGRADVARMQQMVRQGIARRKGAR